MMAEVKPVNSPQKTLKKLSNFFVTIVTPNDNKYNFSIKISGDINLQYCTVKTLTLTCEIKCQVVSIFNSNKGLITVFVQAF